MTPLPSDNTPKQPESRHWKRWFRSLFVTFHALLLGAVLLASAALYIAFRTDSLEIVNTYLLKPLGIEYTRAEGSLKDGFTLQHLRSDTMEAQSLTLRYSLVKMLEGDHSVDEITITGLRIHLDDFTGGGGSAWPLPTFRLKKVTLTNLQLISAYPVELDIRAENGSYDGDALNFKTLEATFASRYASGAVKGTVRNSAITGNALLYPNARELAPYSGRFTDLPRAVSLRVTELSADQARLQGSIERLALKQDPTLTAEGFDFDFTCRYDESRFDVNATYLLRRGEDSMQTAQHLRYAFDGTTTSEFEGTLTSLHPLPSNRLSGAFSTDREGFKATATLDGSTLRVFSADYDHFAWELASDHQNLSFLPALPPLLRDSPLSMKGHGNYLLSTETLGGDVVAEHDYLRFSGNFLTRGGKHALEGNLTLPPDAPMWKEWAHKPPRDMTLSLRHDLNTTRIQLSGDNLALSGTLRGETLRGSGNYLGTYFDLDGTVGNERSVVNIDALIPSAMATLSQLRPVQLHRGEYYDAEIRAKIRMTLAGSLAIRTDISVPWYAVVLDSQRSFGGTNAHATFDYHDGNITLSRYRFEIADHPVESDTPSTMHLTPDGELVIDALWVYDTLLLKGKVSPDLSSALRLTSERFSYKGPEGSLHAAADITFTRDAEANNALAGNVTLLDGTITYLPLQQFKVMDDDVIIVQDVRPPSRTKLSMNLRITADEPLRLQTKELDLRLSPDITLWRDPMGPMQILGMITIPEGTATTAGKAFDIQPSALYFGGDVPLNPYLNFTIGHEVDYKKILIYVTHTLDSPIFLFTSDPVMSQNDIMSYILFGSPANTSMGARAGEDTSTQTIRADATNFMLGAGLKGLISGVTKIQLDTMNILTTQEGGMGFEVGARLNRNLRVLYKNDTLSSILVQYQVNRWLRLDADVHELGQGINAVYIKDFRDFLPHNPPLKR